MNTEYVKHLLIRTPLEEPLMRLRDALKKRRQKRHPELAELYAEPDRVDKLFETSINPNSNCIDIGCHLGSTLSKMIKLAPGGNHMAFEPLPHKAHWLVSKFPEVVVKNMALGNESTELTFFHNRSRSGFSGLSKGGKSGDVVEQITVQCERLEDVVPKDFNPEFIKIDVEGAELMVLQGAGGILQNAKPVVLFECTLDGLQMFDCRLEDIYKQLTDENNYNIFLLKDYLDKGTPLTLAEMDKAIHYPFQAFNFVAAPA